LCDGGGRLSSPLLSEAELNDLGVQFGSNVRVHRSVEIFGGEHISIGRDTRIDCFAVITAGPAEVSIGEGVHLGIGCSLLGTAGITIGDFTSLSPRVSVLSTSDDFRGPHLAGPTVPPSYRQVHSEKVEIGPLAVIGAGSVVLPGSRVGRGASVGALSLVKSSIEPGVVAAGIPARIIATRDLAELEELERHLRLERAQS
jgi:dTDP-4-amino-4,6-dideoxy-D-glucose acyltransferase